MTAKEYLKQAYRLNERINSNMMELEELQQMVLTITAPRFGDKVQTSPNGEASFERTIWKIMELQEKVNREIDTYADLMHEVHTVISTVSDVEEQLVLKNRYINNMTWAAIGAEMNAEESTIRRWHDRAIAHVVLPDNAIRI